MKILECDFCDSQFYDRKEYWRIKGMDYKFCTRRCAENKAKSLGKKWKLLHVR